jgi:hypothetical protein
LKLNFYLFSANIQNAECTFARGSNGKEKAPCLIKREKSRQGEAPDRAASLKPCALLYAQSSGSCEAKGYHQPGGFVNFEKAFYLRTPFSGKNREQR